MTTKPTSNFWWLKKSKTDSNLANSENVDSSPVDEDKLTASLVEFLEKEKEIDYGAGGDHSEVDIDTILEEISRIAAQSPLGPFDKVSEDRSVEDLMKEAEKIYNESSKSFEQLSQHSATSHNITEELNTQSSISTPAQSPIPFNTEIDVQKADTPTPKSITLPLQRENENKDEDENKVEEGHNSEYSDDFSENKSGNTHDPSFISNGEEDSNNSVASLISPVSSKRGENALKDIIIVPDTFVDNDTCLVETTVVEISKQKQEKISTVEDIGFVDAVFENKFSQTLQNQQDEIDEKLKEIEYFRGEVLKKDNIIEHLIEENRNLKEDMKELQVSEMLFPKIYHY
ncbi:hypothetical protein Trydic_g3494 [Trypoxylus dichotomus]